MVADRGSLDGDNRPHGRNDHERHRRAVPRDLELRGQRARGPAGRALVPARDLRRPAGRGQRPGGVSALVDGVRAQFPGFVFSRVSAGRMPTIVSSGSPGVWVRPARSRSSSASTSWSSTRTAGSATSGASSTGCPHEHGTWLRRRPPRGSRLRARDPGGTWSASSRRSSRSVASGWCTASSPEVLEGPWSADLVIIGFPVPRRGPGLVRLARLPGDPRPPRQALRLPRAAARGRASAVPGGRHDREAGCGLTRTATGVALEAAPARPYAVRAVRPPSSSGPGPRPFTAVARVRIPLGVQHLVERPPDWETVPRMG